MKDREGSEGGSPDFLEYVSLLVVFVMFSMFAVSAIRSVRGEVYGQSSSSESRTADKPDQSFVGQVKKVTYFKDRYRVSFLVESDDKTTEEFSFTGSSCDLYFRTGDIVMVLWKRPLLFNSLSLDVKVISRGLTPSGPWIEYR